MPNKKVKGATMSMAEVSAKFGGDPTAGLLPTSSVGKDFAKGKGKGFRDTDDSRGGDDWRGGGGKGFGGKGNRDRDENSRADTGDWFSRDRPSGGGDRDGPDRGSRFGGGRDGPRREGGKGGSDDTPSDWRGSMGQRPQDDRRRDDGPRRGSGDAPSERPRLQLKPRTKDVSGENEDKENKERMGDNKGDDEWDTVRGKATAGAGKYVPPSRRGPEDDRRDAEPKNSSAAGAGGKYVPPSVRKQQGEAERKFEEAEQKRRDAEEKKRREIEEARRKEEEALEAERAKKRELKERKQAEKEASKNAFAQRMAGKRGEDANGMATESLTAFSEECNRLIKDAKVEIEKIASKATAMLTEAELQTIHPTSSLLKPLMKQCRMKSDEEVFSTVKRFAPLLNELIEQSGVHRFKVKVLCETQKIASAMGLPRLSPQTALLEAFLDSLYRAEVIEEDYFSMWAVADDDTPGKVSAMFQVNDFLNFLRDGKYEGDESSDEEVEKDSDEEDEDEDEEEDDDDDIEANVPKRIGQTR